MHITAAAATAAVDPRRSIFTSERVADERREAGREKPEFASSVISDYA